MASNLQINRTLVKNNLVMDTPKKTVSMEAMQSEWKEVRAAQQNPRKFRPLYDRYYEQIYRFIFRRCSDEQLAADICSQVFLKALQKIKSYQFKGVPFSAWLYRIASNEVTQHFRTLSKKRVVSIQKEHLKELVSEEYNLDKELQQDKMLEALDQLAPKDLSLIELRFFEQRPFKEIAEILEITESNAKVKTYRILDRLKKTILKNSSGGPAPKY